MIITTKRHPLRYGVDIFATVLGWVVFFIIFVSGILTLLRGETSGPDVPFLPSSLVASLGTVGGYILLMVCFSILLIIWAKYNQRRFAGVDRRKPPAPVDLAQLCTSFGVSQNQLGAVQTARFIVVAHDGAGEISTIRAIDEALKTRALKRARLPQSAVQRQSVAPVAAASLKHAKTDDKSAYTVPRNWFFLDPKSPIIYVAGTSWADQRDAYGVSKIIPA